MRLAAYRQHNPRIPATAELCSTGRLKRGYGVEDMLRLLSGNRGYRESHNALLDALDELEGNTDRYYKKLYIVGGGAKNTFLNRLTEEATGKQVIALPIEATALGNLKIQMEVNQ